MDKLLKSALIAGALLVGFGVFYHYVIFLPEIERERIAAVERERVEAKAKEETRRVAYADCRQRARIHYDGNWATACATVADARVAEYKNCLNDRAVMGNPYLGVEHCKRTYGSTDASPECVLPRNRADAINAFYKEAQEKCTAEARFGLQ